MGSAHQLSVSFTHQADKSLFSISSCREIPPQHQDESRTSFGKPLKGSVKYNVARNRLHFSRTKLLEASLCHLSPLGIHASVWRIQTPQERIGYDRPILNRERQGLFYNLFGCHRELAPMLINWFSVLQSILAIHQSFANGFGRTLRSAAAIGGRIY